MGLGLRGSSLFSGWWYSRDLQARCLGGFGDRREAGCAQAQWSIRSTGSGVALQECWEPGQGDLKLGTEEGDEDSVFGR